MKAYAYFLIFCSLPLVLWAEFFTVTKISGSVKFRAPREFNTKEVKLKDQLKAGGRLRLKGDASITLTTPKKDEIQFSGDTYVKLEELSKTKDGGDVVKLQLFKGNNKNKVHKLAKDEAFLITTPTAVAGVRGTEFEVNVDESGETEINVLEGLVVVQDVEQTGTEVQVSGGKSVQVKGSGDIDVSGDQEVETGNTDNDNNAPEIIPVDDIQEQAADEAETQINIQTDPTFEDEHSFDGTSDVSVDIESIERN